MRAVRLPSDPTRLVDLDAVVSFRTVGEGAAGTVTIPTSHGDGTVAVMVADSWSLELDTPSGTYLWDRYTEPTDAQADVAALARMMWTGGYDGEQARAAHRIRSRWEKP